MIILYAKNPPDVRSPTNYVMAIGETEEVDNYIENTVSDEIKSERTIVRYEVPISFPFYLTEINNLFTEYQEKPEVGKEEKVVYPITKPYFSSDGRDEMGRLNHWHLPDESDMYKIHA